MGCDESVEIVGYVFERLNAKENRVDKEKIAEEIVEECRKRWIIITKFKDNQFIESINIIQTYLKNVKEQTNIIFIEKQKQVHGRE